MLQLKQMKQSQRGFIAYTVMIAIGIILVGGGFYYYLKGGGGLSGDRQEALARLDTESNTLFNMKARYKAEREIISKIKDQYSSVTKNVLSKTDVFFLNPNSDNPQIKIKIDKATQDKINSKRLQITKMLRDWQVKNEIINSDSLYEDLLPTINDLVKSAEQDMAYVKQYMKELEGIIGGLSPTNSNLTQSQIDSYENIIEDSTAYIEESVVVINQIQAEIPVIIIPPQVIAIGTSTATSTTGSTGTPAPVIPPIVTQTQINEQEQIVAEAEAAVNPPTTSPATTTPPVYDAPTQIIWAPTIIYYLPPTNIDYTGWPDMTRDTVSNKPLLLQGSD